MEMELFWTFNVLEGLTLSKTNTSAILSEAFLEPEIIPPSHSDKVSEPHMRQLVYCNLKPHLEFEEGFLICRPQE
jgi:hypothetical protein